MQALLPILRYGFAAACGGATLYLSGQNANEPRYVFLFLAFLMLMQTRDRLEKRLADRLAGMPLSPFFLLECGALAALAWSYGGLLPFVFVVSILTEQTRAGRFLVQAVLAFGAMNGSAWNHLSADMLIAANLVFPLAAVLQLRLIATTVDRSQYETLNHALVARQQELEEARRTMLDYARKVQDLATMEERNRIAHDLHDDLGHRLVRLNMMLEAALRIGHEDADRAASLYREVKDQLAEGMDALRATVRRLKPVHLAGTTYSLENLLREIGDSSGVQVNYEVVGHPYPVYPSDTIILYRNAQEAITNALRHGGASAVLVTVRYEPDRIRMTVENNGSPMASERPNKGLGLLGMEERVKVVGGELLLFGGPPFAVTTVLPRRLPDV